MRRRWPRRAARRAAGQAQRPGSWGDAVRAQPGRRHLRLRRGFSDATLDGINAADPVLRSALATPAPAGDPIEVRLRSEAVSW